MKMWWVFVMLVMMVADKVSPRKLVYDADSIKENGDRVVAALDRHGAKLDESGADHRRLNIAMAAALERQAAQMDLFAAVLDRLVNATLFQVDVRPLIHGFEADVKSSLFSI
jgi:hypothetical protein